MFKKSIDQVLPFYKKRARKMAGNCKKVFVAGSGGVDSSLVVAILTAEFDPENVTVLFRNLHSNPKHLKDIRDLQKALSFNLIYLDLVFGYDDGMRQCAEQFKACGLPWFTEEECRQNNLPEANAYASIRSRSTVPWAGFISKMIDSGNGRIYGTGNAEEDGLLRYFDKFGDGAVDNNLLDGLTKCEVRQFLLYFAELYPGYDVFKRIAGKTPSADLQANGDEHNDENELTSWARKKGYNIKLSYGDLQKEGNIAWALKKDMDFGIITGERSSWDKDRLKTEFRFSEEELQLILFIREEEIKTRHKVMRPAGFSRNFLRELDLVD